MEDPPGESESPYDCPPYSMRELSAISLQLSFAGSDVEKKQILDAYGMTPEEFRELSGDG
ncbi:hypothetical protein [Streptomyces fumanus]|uniref:Uncharacterized protein n=1 Tax=Streptomyces fumanus TaxID=67302 RepID=A0A919DUP9_9ACTN|nr:hypothetical protein [Streptomyces fumanus]GHE86205.1 hypothetical protein GCM10018772_07200 [Streptomyces fumanus]